MKCYHFKYVIVKCNYEGVSAGCVRRVDYLIEFKEMEYIKIDLPPGCVDRPDISVILKSQRNSQSAEKAKNEYIDLLKTEHKLAALIA
jgi:hypothetical protein